MDTTKTLVAYYPYEIDPQPDMETSVKTVVKTISQLIDADVLQIELAQSDAAQTAGDSEDDIKPAFSYSQDDFAGYDTIILGYPCRFKTFPIALGCFLLSYDFSGKTILPVCTVKEGETDDSRGYLAKFAEGAVVAPVLSIIEGKEADSSDAVKDWLRANTLL